jgi:NAD(P)-dependent dehydrogenase (short-subunit alcohol dehydrogenase family)
MRIDDETKGIPLVSTVRGAHAGELINPRNCYICKREYTLVDAFYHWLCPDCAALSHVKREQRTDLTGKRALLTGGRAKIGMYIALMLLRDGAELTITTRFPHDAVRRFAAMPDSADWLHRLRVVGIDLRDPHQVVELAEDVAAQGHLDVLINNAAQTVRRSAASYAQLAAAEHAAEALETSVPIVDLRSAAAEIEGAIGKRLTPEAVTALALTSGSASLARVEQGLAIDAGGLVPDLAPENSWSRRVHEIDPVELLEVQLCNSVAPFILVSRLRPSLAASPHRRTYVVNVSAMEGQFSRRYKGPGHPHTNMAKAALNMLTRTSAEDMLAEGILMTAVDTGWITDERPHPTKARLHQEGFHAPLDLVDGAARVYDPIVMGEQGVDLYGCFLKDFKVSPW